MPERAPRPYVAPAVLAALDLAISILWRLIVLGFLFLGLMAITAGMRGLFKQQAKAGGKK